MFRIITKRVGKEAREVHVYSCTQMHDHISRAMADAVRANRGFVYMEDVGASALPSSSMTGRRSMSTTLNWLDKALLRVGYKTQAVRIREEWWKKEQARRDAEYSKRISKQQAYAMMLSYFDEDKR